MEPITHGAPASLAAAMAEADLLQRGLRLDHDGVGAGVDQRRRLLAKRVAYRVLRNVAVRLHQPPERPDVADHEARLGTERGARDGHAMGVDLRHPAVERVTLQHDAAGAEGVGEQAVRARLHVAALNRQYRLRVVHVPYLAAAARFQAGLLQLRAHRPVGQQHAFHYRLEQRLPHRGGCRRATGT